jgi:bifunctional non-homologous end joining protein LigD
LDTLVDMPLRPVPPMLAASAPTLPVGHDWTYEVKWDGYRTLAVRDKSGATLWSRRLKNATAHFAAVSRAVGTVRADQVLLDGEVVALGDDGRPSFQALHHQATRHVVYYAFDILHLDGRDLIALPLADRRELLSEVVSGSQLLLSEPLPGSADEIATAVRAMQLEGVVAKRRASVYQPGKRSHSWIKVKFNQQDRFVVGGFTPRGASLDSLLVGTTNGRALLFAGKVRAGLTARLREELMRRLAPLSTAVCPFDDLPRSSRGHWGQGITAADMTTLRWVRPRVVVEVSYVEWARDGLLRHAEFVRLSTE